MLDRAFNLLLGLHSRPATLIRPRSAGDYEVDCRITPSNYFRTLQGPSSTIIEGREFIISIKSLTGFPVELIAFGDTPPTGGTFKLGNAAGETGALDFDISAANLQIALRMITGYGSVTVSGNFTIGFTINFVNVSGPLLLNLTDNHFTGLDDFVAAFTSAFVSWSPLILRGDRIDDDVLGSLSIVEVQEMCDMGGAIMGFRVRTE